MKFTKIILPAVLFALSLFTAIPVRVIAQTVPDPGIAGPYAVSKLEYNFGDLAYTLPAPASAMQVEVCGSVHFPTGLSGGPYPVLLFLHGRHSTCYNTSTFATELDWPCPTGWTSITSYEGYDYLADNMASHGYIVISISSNAINAVDNGLADYGMQERAELVQRHLDLWNAWNTVGGAPFDSLFVGKLNMQNIGTMGHSRGGEGVIYNAQYNTSLGTPYGIRAVLTLAPVDFFRHVLNNIPLLDVAPYCDGDVNDLEGVHFYDDARYDVVNDNAPKHTILFTGANHDFFNTVWTPYLYPAGGADDWLYDFSPTDPWCGASAPGNGRFDTTTQQAALTAYLAAFYRVYIGNETQFAPILEVNNIAPPASSTLDTSQVFVSYHPAAADRLDVNRTDNLTCYTTNTLGGAATETGLLSSAICGGGLSMPDCDAGLDEAQLPHGGASTVGGLGQMRMDWDDSTQWYQNTIPTTNENLTPYLNLLFRASVDFAETATDSNLNLTVQLIDSLGDTGSQVVNNYSKALFYQPGTQPTDLPKEVFNTISIPLSGFTGVNKAKVTNIRFKFNKSVAGAIMISDLAFTNPLCGNVTSLFSDSIGHRYKVIFTNKSFAYDGDTLTYKWNFGDAASGLNDTSTSISPTHTYTTHGAYTACLYVTSKRLNGLICSDSICVPIVLASDEVTANAPENKITVIPNPAKDYIQVNGAASTDVLTLIDLYGQVVLTATLTQPVIQLPPGLATGIYYAVIQTGTGRVYNKLLITR